MKKSRMLFGVTCILAALSFGMAQTKTAPPGAGKPEHAITTPESLQWSPLMPGADMAVVSGDPNKAGELFVIRIKSADGTRVPPHWHPQDEYVTVLKGTFALGMGEKFDASRATSLAQGGHVFIPKQMRHFALSKGETMVQVHGLGPFQINWVNPADDPTYKPAPQKK